MMIAVFAYCGMLRLFIHLVNSVASLNLKLLSSLSVLMILLDSMSTPVALFLPSFDKAKSISWVEINGLGVASGCGSGILV